MKSILLFLALFFITTITNSQDWYRFDYTFKLTDTIDGVITELNPDIIKEKNYQLFSLTSSYSGIRKFYYDQNKDLFRIVSEVMAEIKDPYLIIAKDDSLMGLLLIPQTIKEPGNKVIELNSLKYKAGLFKITNWENSGEKTDIYFKDDKNQRKLEATIIKNPELTKDVEMTIKNIDKSYDYAYPFMGTKEEKPEGQKVYKLDIW